MRVHQMADHVERYFGDIYDVRLQPIARSNRLWTRLWAAAERPGAIYVFSKNATTGWPPEALDRLRRKAAAVLVDYVDLRQELARDWGVDCHITNRQTDDAVTLLGDDYPFMLDDIEPDTLDAGMARLADAFGGPD